MSGFAKRAATKSKAAANEAARTLSPEEEIQGLLKSMEEAKHEMTQISQSSKLYQEQKAEHTKFISELVSAMEKAKTDIVQEVEQIAKLRAQLQDNEFALLRIKLSR